MHLIIVKVNVHTEIVYGILHTSGVENNKSYLNSIILGVSEKK